MKIRDRVTNGVRKTCSAARLLVGTLVFIALPASVALGQDITLTPFPIVFNNPIGIDFHEPSDSLIVSDNYPTGLPTNLTLIDRGGAQTPFSTLSGLTDELKIATVRTSPACQQFPVGNVFTGNGQPGEIVQMDQSGTIVPPAANNPGVALNKSWVKLPGETALLRGSFYVDRFCSFGGDLIVVSGDGTSLGGRVWRVKADGTVRLLADINAAPFSNPIHHLEGVIVVPPGARYGSFAGKILAGQENVNFDLSIPGRLWVIGDTGAVNPLNGDVTFVELKDQFQNFVKVEDLDLIENSSDFFGVAFNESHVLKAGPADFAGMEGDILITQEFPPNPTNGGPTPNHSGLYRLEFVPGPGGTELKATALLNQPEINIQQWEHVTLAPIPGILICPAKDSSTTPVGTLHVTVDPVTGNITARYDQNRDNANDNSYGVNSIGWGSHVHKLKELVGSDNAEFVFKDATGNVVLEFKLDYISVKTGTPSGFGTLGFTGGEGKLETGNASDIVDFDTSIDRNLNDKGFCSGGGCLFMGVDLLIDSPPANANYVVLNPAFVAWEFTNSYNVTVKGSAFGAAGFGSVEIAKIHNSPKKEFEGEVVPCPPTNGGGNECTKGFKPKTVELRYTGLSCTASQHTQDAGKVICSGTPNNASPVHIVASSKDGKKTFFEGQVNLNGTFTIDAGTAGKDTLESDTLVKIFDLQGTLLQSVQFHTSCSQPLAKGNRFGSLEVTNLGLVKK